MEKTLHATAAALPERLAGCRFGGIPPTAPAIVGEGHAPPGDAVTTGIGCRQNGKRPRFVIARALCARGNLGKALPIRKGYRQNGTRQLRL